jgi:hypothetical protein
MRVSRIIKRGLQLATVVPLGLQGAGQSSDVREDVVRDVSLPYEAANGLFKKIAAQKGFRRPHYLWGALHGVNLAKAIGIEKVSLIEFGVAGGNGLTALETIAERLESIFGVNIELYGFGTAGGMPKPTDYRDTPNLWQEGFYPMDVEKLQQRLKRTKLHVGFVGDTVPEFIASKPAPVAFIAFDLCFYSSTAEAFRIFDADQSVLLPRVYCFFRNTLGRTFGDFNGERLAISEFNAKHEVRKISKIYGLRYYVGSNVGRWVDQYCMAHIGDHDLYGRYDGLIQEATLDLPQ